MNENETSVPLQAQMSVFLTPFFLQLLHFQTKHITPFLGQPANDLPLDNELYPYNLLDINPSQLKCVTLESSSNICCQNKAYPHSGSIWK